MDLIREHHPVEVKPKLKWQTPTFFSRETTDGAYYIEKCITGEAWRYLYKGKYIPHLAQRRIASLPSW